MSGTSVTFYSFKGGAGRTMALANVGALLAKWGFRVLVIDWDLEAPGLQKFFPIQQRGERRGLVDLFQDYAHQKLAQWRNYTAEIEIENAEGKLDLIPAGASDHYLKKLHSLDWERLYAENQFGQFLETLRDDWKREYEFILIDSRTGYADIAGITTVQMPDILLLLVTPSSQSLDGSLQVVNQSASRREQLPFDRGSVPTVPVPARIELRTEYEQSQKWLNEFAERFKDVCRMWLPPGTAVREVLNHIRIPSFPYWSFGERMPVLEKGEQDPDDIGYAYETLAAVIGRRLSNIQLLLDSRDDFVRKAKTEARIRLPAGEYAFDVYVSYSHQDSEFVQKVVRHLNAFNLTAFVPRINLQPGNDWEREVARGIGSSRKMLLIVGPNFGPWQMAEAFSGFNTYWRGPDLGKRLIVLVREGVEASWEASFPGFVAFLERDQPFDQLVNRLVQEIST